MIHLGTSGWYYDDWVGTFYPHTISKSEWLPFYTQHFHTVEVNASFYRLPFENMIKGWEKKTPDDFLFVFKGSQVITHRKHLQNIGENLQQFYQRIRLINKKLAVVLWQLPPQLKQDSDVLEGFLSQLDTAIPQVIEFRHSSWFTDNVYALLSKYNVGFCIISAPGFPIILKTTTDFAYIRWHGKDTWYDYLYSPEEIQDWAQRIQKLDVKDIYGFFNNSYNAYAPKNCQHLLNLLDK